MYALCSYLFNNIVLSETPDPWCSWKVWSGGWIDRTRKLNQTRGLPPEVGQTRASRCWTFSSQVKVHGFWVWAWSRNILPANKMIAKFHWGSSADLEAICYEHCLCSHLPSFKRVHSDWLVVIHSEYPRAPVATGAGKKHSWNKWKPTWSALVAVLDLASQLFHIPMQDLHIANHYLHDPVHPPAQASRLATVNLSRGWITPQGDCVLVEITFQWNISIATSGSCVSIAADMKVWFILL